MKNNKRIANLVASSENITDSLLISIFEGSK